MPNQVRVRFAPSPTGMLHIGGARTALFNWAYAKKHNGVFLVRVEDTDQERSTPESKKIILDSLRWLGLDWNEGVDVGGQYGPYVQTERLDIYKYYAEKLISENKAYRCYCTEEDLKIEREEWTKKNPKVGFKYPGTCKGKPYDHSKPHVIRLVATREGTTEFTDKIYGKINTPNIENQDWVIMRTDGIPLYNWGAAVDDSLMKISLVARGADHLQNTIPQILMYKALGFEVPEFAHLPLIRGKNNEKLSKRHASVSVFEYRDNGFAPGALLNYLARLGWSKGNAEVFSMPDFIEMFDWDGCSKNDGKFDEKKLAAVQYEHLKNPNLTPNREYTQSVFPFLQKRGIDDLDDLNVERLIPIVRHKCKTYIEAANELDPMVRKNIIVDSEAAQKFLTEQSRGLLKQVCGVFSSIESWNEQEIRALTQNWLMGKNLTIKDIGQPLRVSIYGRTNSPEIFQVMSAIGKEETLNRIEKQLSITPTKIF